MTPAVKRPTPRARLPIKIKLPDSFTNEPLFLVLRSIKLNDPRVIFVVALLVGVLADILVGILTGNWNSRPGVVGVFDINNIPPLIMSLIVEPGIWAFFVGFPPALFEMFETIQKKGILLTEQDKVQTQVNRLEAVMSSRVFILAAIPLAIVIAIYAMYIIGEYQPTPWFYSYDVWYWVRALRVAVSAYVSVYSIAWSLMALQTLYNLFSTAKLKVNPYDGDNAGGLLFVGRFILKVSRVTLIIVPLLIAETLFALRLGRGLVGQFNLWLEISLLPLLLSIMVFLPLAACRRAMLEARGDFVNPLRDRIVSQVSEFHASTSIQRTRLEQTEALINFQTKLRKEFPTWPFDFSVLQQIWLSVLLSLLPAAFNIIQLMNTGFVE